MIIQYGSFNGRKQQMKRCILAVIFTAVAFPLAAGGYYDQGISLYKAKSYTKAREALQNEVAGNPSNGMAWYFLGETCKNINDYSGAEAAFRQAVVNPIQHKYLSLAYWNLVVIVEQKNDVGQIIQVCRSFYMATGEGGAKRKVDDIINKMIWSDNQQALDIYKEGCDLRDQKQTKDAKAKFNDAISADSTFLAPRFELGQILYAEGKARDAIEQFRIIADKVPYYGSVQLLIGEIYYNDKSFDSAADAFSKALDYGFFDKDTQFNAYLKLASCQLSLKDLEKAGDAAGKALRINGTDKDALMLMSAIDIRLDRYDDALKTLTKLQRVEPDNADIIYQIGSIYFRQKNLPKYTASFDQLFELASQNGTQIPSKYHKAMQILLKAHFTDANYLRVTEIYALIPESTHDAEISLCQAKALYHTKHFTESVSLFEKLSLTQDDRFFLCQAYVKAGNKSKAKSSLIALISQNQTYSGKASADPVLSPVMKDIDADKQKEQQRIKAQQVQAQPKPAGQQAQPAYIPESVNAVESVR